MTVSPSGNGSAAVIEELARERLGFERLRPGQLRRSRPSPTWRAGGEVQWTGTLNVVAALKASEAETEREGEVERSRLTMMRRYAEHAGCRRSFLLSYFGQDYPGPCGNCDNGYRELYLPAVLERGLLRPA